MNTDFAQYDMIFNALTILIMLMGTVPIYFAPALIAVMRGHRNMLEIWLWNFLSGWTVIGWFIVLYWSCTSDYTTEEEEYLHDQEEF